MLFGKSVIHIFCIVASVFLFLLSQSLVINAEDVNPKEILAKADIARGNASGIEWNITIEVKGGKADGDKREILVKAKNENSVALFLEPRSVKGQKLLMKKNNMWFIKPGVSKPVSISPRQRLLGGAANADVASTNYANDYDATLVTTETVEETECYVFDLKAKTKKVTYAQIKYWVAIAENLGIKAEFYSVSGKLLKTAFFKYNELVEVEGAQRPFVSEMRIQDAVLKDSETIMTYRNIKVAEIPASEFSLQR